MNCQSQLDQLVTSVEQALCQISKIRKQHDRISFSEQEIEAMTTGVVEISRQSQQLARRQAILSTINYAQRPARHESIPDAHQRTFTWIFDSPTPSSSTPGGSHFSKWLRTGDAIFWISGRPGSGKSTLMKFTADHKSTRNILSEWAAPRSLVIAKHYFWSAGTDIQRSQEGLLRSLLFEIMRQIPSLIQVLCKKTWDETAAQDTTHWGLQALRQALSAVKELKDLPLRFCFFIDGLDEFNGDHSEVCETIKDLCRSPHIKACVASRPWNVFEDAFGAMPERRLNVHELTHNDIVEYARSRLYDHPRWAELIRQSPQAGTLVADISSRAHGVFLWVFLVTRELRAGMTNDDSFTDLQLRLHSLPVELEPFFKHMLNSIEPFYSQKMARTLAIAVNATEPLLVELYALQELEYEDHDYALRIKAEPHEYSDLYFQSLLKPVYRRINGRTKGLLEINGGRIEFLHRTVKDFLHTKEMADFLRTKSGAEFCGSLSILRSYVARMGYHLGHIRSLVARALETPADPARQWPLWGQIIRDQIEPLLREALGYAQVCDDHDETCLEQTTCLLDTLEVSSSLVAAHLAASSCGSDMTPYLRTGVIDPEYEPFGFRELVVTKCLSNYVAAKLQRDPDFLAGTRDSGFRAVLQPDKRLDGQGWRSQKQIAIIRALCLAEQTRAGRDARQGLLLAVWTWLVGGYPGVEVSSAGRLLLKNDPERGDFIRALETGIFDLLLELGADPDLFNAADGMTAWSGFFVMGFIVYDEVQEGQGKAYLRVLDRLLAPRSLSQGSSCARMVSRECPAASSPFWAFLEHYFKNEPPATFKGNKGEFVGTVMAKLLASLEYRTPDDIGARLPSMLKPLPEDLRASIMEAFEEKTSSGGGLLKLIMSNIGEGRLMAPASMLAIVVAVAVALWTSRAVVSAQRLSWG